MSSSSTQSPDHHVFLLDNNCCAKSNLGDPLLSHDEQGQDGAGFVRTSFNGLNALSGV